MGISKIISNIVSSGLSSERFEQLIDSSGVIFKLPVKAFDACQSGKGSEWMLNQYIYLKMLEEQGSAEQIRNGFRVLSSDIVSLEKGAWELLELPARFPGGFNVRVEGETFSKKFDLEIIPVTEDGQREPVYKIKGPFLTFGAAESYLLSLAQYRAFEALKNYCDSTTTGTSEKHNLKLIGE